jgi:hypothetical protein
MTGAGRAKLRLSRGFPRYLAYDVIPYRMVDQSTKEFMGGHPARQDDPESPGSGGASPYLPAWPPTPGFANDVIPYGIVDLSTKDSWGHAKDLGSTKT